MVDKSNKDDAKSSGNIPFKNDIISLADDVTDDKTCKIQFAHQICEDLNRFDYPILRCINA